MNDPVNPVATTQPPVVSQVPTLVPPNVPQQQNPVNVFNQTQNPADQSMVGMNAVLNQVATTQDPLNPARPSSSTAKETAPLNIEVSGEMPSGMQSVEQLRTPEISPEVEKYIEEVREEPSSFPHEVVLADQQMVQPSNGFVAQPVIVLPMTEEEFKEAKKAPPETSRRWLAEFTEKIRKIFEGGVMFRQKAPQS